MRISGRTRVCAVIGDPVEHSLSPVMHNAAFEAKNLDFVFVSFRVEKGKVGSALRGMRSLNIHGLNVTMPHKCAVLKYLDEVDETAYFLGSVNTILNCDGKLVGFNTDGSGAVIALRENNVTLQNAKLLLIGGGGAAKAIAHAVAAEVEELVILNRTLSKIASFAEHLRRRCEAHVHVEKLSEASIVEHLRNADVLINATCVGMHPYSGQSLIPARLLRSNLTVMDIVYHPLETKLLSDAKAVGAKIINGLEMLVYQGAASFRIWTGVQPPVDIMREAVLKVSNNQGA
jgi:shikimate dehydrogenase